MSLPPLIEQVGVGASGAYHLRAATAADQKAIKALIRAARINPLGIDWRRFVVAVDAQGALLGCGQVKLHRDGSRELASIAVARAWRKQGVARTIIHYLLQTHPAPLWLTCLSRLIPFYAQFGFREVTDAAQMPPYFRRVYRLYNLFARGQRPEGYLAVMVRALNLRSPT